MNKRRDNSEPSVTLSDRIGIGLLSAFSFLFIYVIIYGVVVLSIHDPNHEFVEEVLPFMLKLFLFGPLFSFFLGFVFVVNPIELIINFFNNKKY